jgi:hypothetical protein
MLLISRGFVKQIMPYFFNLCQNCSLDACEVVSLTTAKYKSLVLTVCGLACTNVVNICIFMI